MCVLLSRVFVHYVCPAQVELRRGYQSPLELKFGDGCESLVGSGNRTWLGVNSLAPPVNFILLLNLPKPVSSSVK